MKIRQLKKAIKVGDYVQDRCGSMGNDNSGAIGRVVRVSGKWVDVADSNVNSSPGSEPWPLRCVRRVRNPEDYYGGNVKLPRRKR
jgi:hypothetical protein